MGIPPANVQLRHGGEFLDDGELVVVETVRTHRSEVRRLTLSGLQVWRNRDFKGQVIGLRRLTHGGVAVAEYRRLVELDAAGQLVREATLGEGEYKKHVRAGTFRHPLWNTEFSFDLLYSQLAEHSPDGRILWVLPRVISKCSVRLCYPVVGLGFEEPRPKNYDLASVPTCLRCLASKDPEVRRLAALGLGCVEIRGRENAPKETFRSLFEAAARETQDDVWRDLVRTAYRYARPENLTEILAATNDKRVRLRRASMRLLQAYPTNPSEVIPILVKCLKDEDPEVRARAALTRCKFFRPEKRSRRFRHCSNC